MSSPTITPTSTTITKAGIETGNTGGAPVFQRSWVSSLSGRITLAMVAVAFLSALIGGILYQWQVGETVGRLDTRNRAQVIENINQRLQNSRLPPNLIKQVEEALQLRPNALTARPTLELALDRAIWIVIAVAVLASGLAFALGYFLTRGITRPMEQLRQASQQVANGDFSQRVIVNNSDEVGQVAYSFNLMATQLEHAETRRRQMLSDIAHELKTPLASIQGHVEALRDGLPRAKANPEAIYDIVLDDVNELNRMVSSLRTWLDAHSLLENLELRSLKLPEELPAIAERFRPRAEANQVHLLVEIDRRVTTATADRAALRHLLSNLLDNALRYTSPGGTVKLMAWLGEGEQPGNSSPANPRVTLAVSDTGIGIASQHLPFIFERFYRVDKSRTRDTGGTGLGLALVRDLTQAQKGRVWVRSAEGRGTIFFINLPI